MVDRDENTGPLSFADVGIPAPKNTKNTCFGKIRSWQSLTKLETAFLVTSLTGIVCFIVFTCIRIANMPRDDPDFTFAILVLVNAVICLYYAVNGIMYERPCELILLVLATITIWIYLVLNYAISVRTDIKLARMVVTSVLGPALIAMGVYICRHYMLSKNLIFRTVGANADLQKMCNTMFIFIDLLKADLQISVSMAILVMNDGTKLNLEDKILLPVVLVVSSGTFAAGYCSVRLESRLSALFFVILWFVLPAYAMYLVVKAGQDLQDTSHDSKTEIGLYAVLFVTAAIALVLRMATLFFGVKVYKHFGKGLAKKVFGDPTQSTTSSVTEQEPNINGSA
ncbi:uncharacterized protein LOC127832411 [Dreissena polymorpha]|uniref:DUF7789 domain-containing protein n=1 Tax=Dreissena polymorpha TaxID=45954 RepID=A0A9D4GTL1_DREPO|nr:uncharacterized protein LOC127832411 [Dreissena polymorpha]KAH3821249.1 hypothetical protein DPMN_123011 [Dreissena polymorpha]